MTEFEKASAEMKRTAVNEFKKKLISEISSIYEHNYLTVADELDEFYQDVLKIIRNA